MTREFVYVSPPLRSKPPALIADGASKWKRSVASPPTFFLVMLTVPYVANALEAPAVQVRPTQARSAASPIRAAALRGPACAERKAPNICNPQNPFPPGTPLYPVRNPLSRSGSPPPAADRQCVERSSLGSLPTRLSGAYPGSNGCPPRRAATVQRAWTLGRQAGGGARLVVDVDRRSALGEAVQPEDVAVAQADAPVRRPAGDEAGLVRAVQADDAAARPVRQRRGVGARADRARAVQRDALHVELLADVEVPGRRDRALLADADARGHDDVAVVEDAQSQVALVDVDHPVVDRHRAQRALRHPALRAVRTARHADAHPGVALRVDPA